MTIITPTFGDQQRSDPHVTAAHEPLAGGEPFMFPAPYSFGTLSMPVLAPPLVPTQDPKPLKIALVGTAPSSRLLAPYRDTSWTIWGCSPGNMGTLPRFDAWFEVHSNLLWPEHESYGAPYIEWLKKLTVPVYMQDQSQVPNALAFPWKELVAEFGEDFFTSSFAWMMAFAMKQPNIQEIALYGIDMASRDEYILQRPGFFFFRHLARLRGVKISAPNESDIMQSPPLYAISDSTPFGRKVLAREKEIKDRLAPMIAQRDQLNGSITYLQGALEDVDYFKSIWTGAQRPS